MHERNPRMISSKEKAEKILRLIPKEQQKDLIYLIFLPKWKREIVQFVRKMGKKLTRFKI